MVRGEERRWGGGGVAVSWTLVECDVVRGGREGGEGVCERESV